MIGRALSMVYTLSFRPSDLLGRHKGRDQMAEGLEYTIRNAQLIACEECLQQQRRESYKSLIE